MVKKLLVLLFVITALYALWRSMPISVRYHTEIERGEELAHGIAKYRQRHQTLPASEDWRTLEQIGFLPAEEERAYPQYSKIDDTTYELAFIKGFDGPYLQWNSKEHKWKVDFATIPLP